MMDRQTVVKRLNQKNWALLHIAKFKLRNHINACENYILAKDGYTELLLEFNPCKSLDELTRKYQRSYNFCQHHIHHLTYYPTEPSLPCSTTREKLKSFIENNAIDLVLYKGGTIEKNLCAELGIDSFDIDYFENELQKIDSHDPYKKTNHYFIQLVEIVL